MKLRYSDAGIHVFDRRSGLNVLLDEVSVPSAHYSRAPRYVSVALTNACELTCSYCYAPKTRAALDTAQILRWSQELDANGCLGVGFGGGEPTSHPHFAQLCRQIARSTTLAVSFTTHGHRITPELADAIRGHIHFIRLSVDGIDATYERQRGRPFAALCTSVSLLASIAPFGINTVVNSETLPQLDDIAAFAERVGATQLLLLPEQATSSSRGLDPGGAARLVSWIRDATCSIQLALSRSGLEGLVPVAEPMPGEHPMDAHVHIDAAGVVRRHAFASEGKQVTVSVLEAVRALREAA